MARFQETFCSQCGKAFGPGDSGFSHCHQHRRAAREARSASRLARLHQMHDGPIPKRLLDWAQRGEPPHVEWRRRWAAARATLAGLDAQLPSVTPGVVYDAQAGWRREAKHCATMYARTKREFA